MTRSVHGRGRRSWCGSGVQHLLLAIHILSAIQRLLWWMHCLHIRRSMGLSQGSPCQTVQGAIELHSSSPGWQRG